MRQMQKTLAKSVAQFLIFSVVDGRVIPPPTQIRLLTLPEFR